MAGRKHLEGVICGWASARSCFWAGPVLGRRDQWGGFKSLGGRLWRPPLSLDGGHSDMEADGGSRCQDYQDQPGRHRGQEEGLAREQRPEPVG